MTPETKAQIEQEAETKYPITAHITGAFFNDKAKERRKGYIAGATHYAEKWEAAEKENKRLREALEKLVLLKQHKDIVGKDEYYKREQPLAWEQATEALKPKQ